jgi:integrase
MGISHQTGSIVLRGKRWYGYYRKEVIDPTTDNVRVVRVVVRLGLKSQMTKLAAREALRAEIAGQTSQVADGGVLMDGSATFEWFVRNRYFPLRQGDWRPETAKEKTAQIEIDLIRKFGAEAMESIDKFALQTHVNELARRYSQDRVKQARSYLKSIFDEAIEQGFLVKDPTRKLKIPRNLRPKDKQVLTWDQLRDILATAARRDRLLLMLDMTEALRPSELFALRWLSFDNKNTLSLTETVYRRKLRPFGKTTKSLGKVHLPDGLAEDLRQWKLECPDPSPKGVHVSERRRRSTGPGELSQSGSEASRRGSGLPQADLPGAPPYDGDPGTESGIGEGHPGTPPALARGYHRERVHAGTP